MTPNPGFIYLAKGPPLHHGVARHAARMIDVLAGLGDVVTIRVKAAPSNTVPATISALRSVRSALHRHPQYIVWVEMSGLSVAELWVGLYCTRMHRVWLTVHDAPAVTAAPLAFRSLDRRFLRRVPRRYLASLGRALERRLLRDAERVFCLSPIGADALVKEWELDRLVESLPAPVGPSPRSNGVEQRTIFCPGWTTAAAVAPVIESVAQAGSRTRWLVAVGPTDAVSESIITEIAAREGVRVMFTGTLDEGELSHQFDNAAVVVDLRGSGADDGPARGAVLGHAIDAMGSGCAFVTSRPRGSAMCLADTSLIVTQSSARATLVRLLDAPDEIHRLQTALRNHGVRFHSAPVVRDVIQRRTTYHQGISGS